MKNVLLRYTLGAACLLGVALSACAPTKSTTSGMARMNGTVTYRERIALEKGARVTVELADVSNAETPVVLARHEIDTRGEQVPIPFTLWVDRSSLLPTKRYALKAQIAHNGAVRFSTTTGQPVDPAKLPDSMEVVVMSAR